MSARTLIYKLMVAGPIVLTLGIGVEARTHVDDFEPLGYTKAENTAVAAYAGVVAETKPVLAQSLTDMRSASTRTVAEDWISGARRGVLQPIKPAFYEDSFQDGVKGQIARSNNLLCARLNRLGKNELDNHNTQAGLRDLLDSIRTAEILKYSDFSTLISANLNERRALQLMARYVGQYSQADKAGIRDALAEIQHGKQPITLMARRTRDQYDAFRIRRGESPLGIENTKPFERVSEGDGNNIRQQLESVALASADNEIPEIVNGVTLGFAMERDTDKAIVELRNSLQDVSAL